MTVLASPKDKFGAWERTGKAMRAIPPFPKASEIFESPPKTEQLHLCASPLFLSLFDLLDRHIYFCYYTIAEIKSANLWNFFLLREKKTPPYHFC
jgi:hypothetical protein